MRSIRATLTIRLMIPLAIVATIVAVETFYSSKKVSAQLNDRTLLAASLTILEHVILSNGSLLADTTLESLTESLGDRFFYHVRGPNGAFVTGYSEYPRFEGLDNYDQNQPIFFDGVHQGEVVRVVRISRDLTNRELNGITIITTWHRTSQRKALTLSLFTHSLLRLILLSLMAGVIVWFAVKAGLRPLLRLQNSIDQRSNFALSPIQQTVPEELSGIVHSMNTLFERVARSKKHRERFIGDAAHQLRNPIAAIKVQAQSSLESDAPDQMRQVLQQILAVSDKSASMINKMLTGANAHAMDRTQHTQFDLSELVNNKTSALAPMAFDRSQDISVAGTDKVVSVLANRTLLGEAISNLIHNAIQHNEQSTRIAVSVKLVDDGTSVIVSVSDEGKPIDDARFVTLTQPFLSEGDNQSGSGLGLSIAKDIARMHRGNLLTAATKHGKEIYIHIPV